MVGFRLGSGCFTMHHLAKRHGRNHQVTVALKIIESWQDVSTSLVVLENVGLGPSSAMPRDPLSSDEVVMGMTTPFAESVSSSRKCDW